MNTPQFSIIVPVYNSEKYLSFCIESIIKQSFKNIEILLINDGSYDSSLNICNNYAKKDKRIRVFSHSNMGVSYTRNIGIKKSKSDFLVFIDSDDFIEDDLISSFQNVIENFNPDFIICNINIIDKKINKVLKKKLTISGFIDKKILNSLSFLFYNEKLNPPWGKCYKKSIISEFFLNFNESITLQEDLLFNIDYIQHINNIYFEEKNLYNYVKHYSENLTNKYFSNKFEMLDYVHDRLIFLYKKKNIDNKFEYLYFKNVFSSILNLYHNKCSLHLKDKLKLIDHMLCSNKFKMYLTITHPNTFRDKILLIVLKTKSSLFVYYISYVFYILKYKFNYKYSR